ncbi:MAG TPA: 4Fe-4S dicluster domain-containing protein [Rhizomicrobium sp.]|nr:4Fe-4S dicluster domain-containing protein [Rhizomicrobium sp.]
MPPLRPPFAAIDRRTSLKLLASAMSVAMASCGRPEEEIIPYADMPEGLVAGEPQRYATTLCLGGYGRGFLAIAVDGRPIKIEGNARHPASLGATDIFAEAEVLSLYDPDSSKIVQHKGAISNWEDFETNWSKLARSARIGLVTGRILSPTTLARIDALRGRYPSLRWYRYEPINDDAERQGARLAFGQVLSCRAEWEAADVILCLDADPLGHGPDQLRIARAFAQRRATAPRQKIYAVEPAWTLTGAAADHRLALAPGGIVEFAKAIANSLGASLGPIRLAADEAAFAEKVARDLRQAHGRALMLAGRAQSPEMHALCHWLNDKLAAPVTCHAPLDPVMEDHGQAMTALAQDMRSGALDALVVLGCNPIHDAPDRLEMAQAMDRVPLRIQAGLHADESAAHCQWVLPLSHALESWGDARATDGTVSLVQPLIRPLRDSRTADEILALLAGEEQRKAHDLIQGTWRAKAQGNFDNWWRKALSDGVIPGEAAPPIVPPPPKLVAPPPALLSTGITLVLAPHHSVWDGRYANNAWLQECPAPFTKEVWGNSLYLAPEDGNKLGLADGDSVDLSAAGQTVSAPVAIMPGQASGVAWSAIGQGRRKAGRIGTDVGCRYAALLAAPFDWRVGDLRIAKSAKALVLHSTQTHTQLQGRAEELFQTTRPGARAEAAKPPPPSVLPVPSRDDYAWAMVIDTDACIGCNACVVACQSENNVPVVGPEEIALGRDMHWLRVDSYAVEKNGQARRGFQTVPCMHCELAPCEPVCPVEASVHDHEGLNVQVYNRCIGTRFCEANCPYKVRRFNWYDYSGEQAYADQGDALKAQHNPDVSVRGRGVMEKCNYCLQRVSRARRTAEKEGRKIAEGEMVTACQAACPTRAIHFGDLNNADSDVSHKRQDARHYTLLEELNTRPRTTFLKRVYDDGEGI